MRIHLRSAQKYLWRICYISVVLLIMCGPYLSQNVAALQQCDIDAINGNWPNYATDECVGGCVNSISFGGTLDQFLQAVALHESGGNPTANSGNGAYGKYQYIPRTWQGVAKQYYGPAQQYATANLAPEAIQDAVAYLNYVPVTRALQGDIFAMAIEHYYPADAQIAHNNPKDPALNYAPPGNGGLTLKAYGNAILDIIKSGKASKIPLLYTGAPDFQTWLAKVGGSPAATPASNSSPLSGCNSSGIPAGSFVFYSQADPRWASHPYGSTTIQVGGCGPTSVAEVVATLADKSVTPIQTADWGTANGAYVPGKGSIWGIMLIKGPEHWGLKSNDIGKDMTQAVNIINAGGLVIITGQGAAPFTSGGHILVLRGIDSNGNFLVGDPNSPPSNPGNPQNSYSAQQLLGAGLQNMFGVTK